MTENPTTREIATCFEMMLIAGWIDRPAVIEWADSVIAEQDDPDPALIDVSMSRREHPAELFSHLHQIRGSLDPEISAKMFFAYGAREYEAGRKSSKEILKSFFELFYYGVWDIALPENVTRSFLDCEISSSLISYLTDDAIPRPSDLNSVAQVESELRDARQKLDHQMRMVLDWTRDYRDKLPPQCFPHSTES